MRSKSFVNPLFGYAQGDISNQDAVDGIFNAVGIAFHFDKLREGWFNGI